MSDRSGEPWHLQLGYYGYVAGSAAAGRLPERQAYWVAHRLGELWARCATNRREVVAANLARVTGEPPGSARLEALTAEAFRSYARYWLELFRLVREDKEFFLERFTCDGEEHLRSVLDRGAGALIVVGHLGNWDAAAGWVGASGRRLETVAEILRPRRLFEFFAAQRGRLGVVVHPAERRSAIKLVEALRRGSVVAILGDRDLRGDGPEIDFFGATTTLPGGPAAVALKAGVPILVAGVYGVQLPGGKRGWWAQISAPIELPETHGEGAVAALTRSVAVELERHIARAPEEWHVFRPFWPTAPSGLGRTKKMDGASRTVRETGGLDRTARWIRGGLDRTTGRTTGRIA
ncbi:MAG: phosphatidylinositol mannoside acyltransferase [Actinobacteria bacterium]|nr:phosphatidylinositol mannoside acyltransferase [Actinomycetota bacterium]